MTNVTPLPVPAWTMMRQKADGLREEARGLCTDAINERNKKPYRIISPEAAVLFRLADRLYLLAHDLEKEFNETGDPSPTTEVPGPRAQAEGQTASSDPSS